MNNDDRKFLAYLTAWAVDRMVTNAHNIHGTGLRVCSYGTLREQAEATFQNFYPVADEPKEMKEMTAYELVERMSRWWGFCKGAPETRASDLFRFAKKEAGL